MKENQRVRITKLLLKKSLIELMKQKSIYKISIKEICELADLNRSTFYKYYNTEFDLLKDIENEYLTTIDDYISQISHHLTIRKLLEYVIDNIEVFRLFLDDIPGINFYERLIELCLKIMTYDQMVVVKAEKDNINDYVFRFIIFGALSVVKSWIEKEDREAPAEMNEILMSILGKFMNMQKQSV